jgi:hypothetical protein
MSKYLDLYEKFKEIVKNDKSIEPKIINDFTFIYHDIYTHVMKSDESYCYRFVLPTAKILKIFNIVGFTPEDLDYAVTTDWKLPPEKKDAVMRHDPYYQILTFLCYHGIKTKNEKLIKFAYIFILIRLWNGRLGKFLKYCDKKVMKYIISYMGNNRYLFKKYPTPFSLINEYFVTTILIKYRSVIDHNYLSLSTLLDQGHDRIRQLFVQNSVTNVESGKKEASGGILPLYYKAKNENLYLSIPKVGIDGGFDDFTTTSNRESIVQNTCNDMSMNPNPSYPKEHIETLNKELTLSIKGIETILKALHKYNYYDILQEILLIMLSQLKINSKSDICSSNFHILVKKNIISSKNNTDSKKLQEVTNGLLKRIFDEIILKNFENFSNVQQIKLRNLVIYGLAYNLRKVNCGKNA